MEPIFIQMQLNLHKIHLKGYTVCTKITTGWGKKPEEQQRQLFPLHSKRRLGFQGFLQQLFSVKLACPLRAIGGELVNTTRAQSSRATIHRPITFKVKLELCG